MGCDIWLFVEHYDHDKAAWEMCVPNAAECELFDVTPPYVDEWWGFRSYSLFGKLAGVRSGEAPFEEPKGAPDDSCQEIKGHMRGLHTITHYRLDRLIREFEMDPDSEAFSFFADMLQRMKRLGPPAFTRLVMGFDS